MTSPSFPTLSYEVTYVLRSVPRSGTTGGSPQGRRQYFEITEATVTGDRIHARLAGSGAD
jgi:hypothetical protein